MGTITSKAEIQEVEDNIANVEHRLPSIDEESISEVSEMEVESAPPASVPEYCRSIVGVTFFGQTNTEKVFIIFLVNHETSWDVCDL